MSPGTRLQDGRQGVLGGRERTIDKCGAQQGLRNPY